MRRPVADLAKRMPWSDHMAYYRVGKHLMTLCKAADDAPRAYTGQE
jgi:hypothetical protein